MGFFFSETTNIRRVFWYQGKMLSLHEKSDPPHNLHLSLLSNLSVENSNCTCKAGCGNCNHILGLMYLSCHYKKLEWKTVPSIISKTSIPQRLHGVNPEAVEDIQVQEFQIQKERELMESIQNFIVLYSSRCLIKTSFTI